MSESVESVSDAAPDAWVSGWGVTDPPELGASLVRHAGDRWGGGHRADFEYRELGLSALSGDFLHARHIRRVSHGKVGYDWHCHDADFQFNYVINGTSHVETTHGAHYTLGPGQTMYEPGLYTVREYDFSEDYECIQISVSGGPAGTITGRNPTLPERAALLNPDRRSIHTSEGPGSYVAATGTDGLLERRDLATSAPTNGRIELSIVRSVAPLPPAGFEYRTEARWLVLLGGSAILRIEGQPPTTLERFDAACFGDREPQPITVGPDGFAALEMRLPSATRRRGQSR